MTTKDIIWIISIGLGSGLAGLAAFELINRLATPRHHPTTSEAAIGMKRSA